MELRTETELTREIERLRAELARREREAADNERQLERYATDLRETFKEERERSQQLTRSYMATVRALSNAAEARDAYTGTHAERVAAYGIEIAVTASRHAVARRESPALVFLDVDVPRKDRIETCRQLRAAEQAGADLFLTKPFSPLELLRPVDRLGGDVPA